MKREYPESPIIGVGGVIFKDRTVLLVKRDKEPAKGEWSLPGGAVELGETLIKALKREIYEEVSIDIDVGGLVKLIDRIVYDDKNMVQYHYVIADYWGWFLSGRPKAGSDVSEVCFVPLDDIKKRGVNKIVEEIIEKAVEMGREYLK